MKLIDSPCEMVVALSILGLKPHEVGFVLGCKADEVRDYLRSQGFDANNMPTKLPPKYKIGLIENAEDAPTR